MWEDVSSCASSLFSLKVHTDSVKACLVAQSHLGFAETGDWE